MDRKLRERDVRAVGQGRPTLLSVDQLAEMIACSVRHVRRLADAGAMPAPVRVGALVRWPAQDIDDWIQAGCPHVGEEVRRA